MKVIVIPDNCYITRVPEVNDCKGCVFENLSEDENNELDWWCAMDKTCRVPCVGTIYAIVEYRDDEEGGNLMGDFCDFCGQGVDTEYIFNSTVDCNDGAELGTGDWQCPACDHTNFERWRREDT